MAMTADGHSSPIRVTKRKLDDAIQSLDTAVGSSESLAHSPPPKRFHTSRSIYSTLSKYGINLNTPSRTPVENANFFAQHTPTLHNILTRATKKLNSSKLTKEKSLHEEIVSNKNLEYRPSSITSFLSRLSTFKLSTYSNKPAPIDAVAAAKCGWVNEGKDRLVCSICGVSWVLAGRGGMSKDAANALVEKQRGSLIDMHKIGCPWKTKQCDASIYSIPMQNPFAMAKEVAARVIPLQLHLEGVNIKHPLTPAQVQIICSIVSSALPPTAEQADSSPASRPGSVSPPPAQADLSEAATLASLFGWSLAPPQERTSRTPSVISAPQTPSLYRSRSATPMLEDWPMSTPPQSRRSSMHIAEFHSPGRLDGFKVIAKNAPLLYCALCQRRVGLWTFSIPKQDASAEGSPGPRSQKQFDLLKEHRTYCPYVVRSTTLPTFPLASDGDPHPHHSDSGSTVIGWQAVTTVLLRYATSRGAKTGISAPRSDMEVEANANWVDDNSGVDAMLASVKKRGGKELLKYVKGLLG